MSSDLMGLLRTRLLNFRLLEAAGISEVFSFGVVDSYGRSKKWWNEYASVCRVYRAQLVPEGEIADPNLLPNAIRLSHTPELTDISAEIVRVAGELQQWYMTVPGGQAYIALLQAYVNLAELDGVRVKTHLSRALRLSTDLCPLTERMNECLVFLSGGDASSADSGPLSVYEAMQLVSDHFQQVFELEAHPFSDLRRFVILPAVISD